MPPSKDISIAAGVVAGAGVAAAGVAAAGAAAADVAAAEGDGGLPVRAESIGLCRWWNKVVWVRACVPRG